MTDEAFASLVARLELQARRAPRRYQWKVVALAVLGNAYLLAVLALVLTLLLTLIASIAVLQAAALKVMVVVGVLLVLIGKSLWVKVQTPQGHAVTPEQAPELFVSIRRLRRSMRAPRIHEVLVTDDFNAAVVQVPRLGIFGWPKNHLLIGLPLMRALTVDQFEAVLAHEFAHLAHGHGRLANWVYCRRHASDLEGGHGRRADQRGRGGRLLVGTLLAVDRAPRRRPSVTRLRALRLDGWRAGAVARPDRDQGLPHARRGRQNRSGRHAPGAQGSTARRPWQGAPGVA
jgi:hypothetical protein